MDTLPFRVEFARALLRAIYTQARDQGQSLMDALETILVARADDITAGQVVASTASEGVSVSYTVPRTDGVTPEKVLEFVSWLIGHATLLTGTDEAIHAALQAKLKRRPFTAVGFRSLAR